MCLKNELSTMINNCATIILISAFFFPLGAIFLAGTVLIPEWHLLKTLSKECQLVSQCWIGLKGGEQLRGDIFVNATAQVSFENLRDSINPQGLKRCNVGRVEWEEFVCSRVPPNRRVVPVFLALLQLH